MMRIRKGGAKRGHSPKWWIEATRYEEFRHPRFVDYGYTYVLDAQFFSSKKEAEEFLKKVKL